MFTPEEIAPGQGTRNPLEQIRTTSSGVTNWKVSVSVVQLTKGPQTYALVVSTDTVVSPPYVSSVAPGRTNSSILQISGPALTFIEAFAAVSDR